MIYDTSYDNILYSHAIHVHIIYSTTACCDTWDISLVKATHSHLLIVVAVGFHGSEDVIPVDKN
jgi:hypothetical protein